MPNLSEILNSINHTKDADLIDDYNSSDYSPYQINRGMSLFPDTILLANEIAAFPHLDRILQYKYYLYGVRKKKRYSKWLSAKKVDDDNQIIAKYYGISIKQAKSVKDLITPEDLQNMKKYFDKGGVSRNS